MYLKHFDFYRNGHSKLTICLIYNTKPNLGALNNFVDFTYELILFCLGYTIKFSKTFFTRTTHRNCRRGNSHMKKYQIIFLCYWFCCQGKIPISFSIYTILKNEFCSLIIHSAQLLHIIHNSYNAIEHSTLVIRRV